MRGKRRKDLENKGNRLSIKEGEYMKLPNGDWFIHPPGGVYGTISPTVHQITEHEDGTITVSPSILYHADANGKHGWHGYLERGVWRTV